MASDGTVVSVWRLTSGAVRARIRPPGQLFGQTQTLGTSGEDPRVAVDEDGDAIAIWSEGGAIRFRVRPPDGLFGPLQPALGAGSAPVVAMNAGGDAVMAWNDGNTNVKAIVRDDGTLETAKTIPATNAADLDATINARQVVALVWRDNTDDVRGVIRDSAGTWKAPKMLDASGSDPAVTMAASGLATAVWNGTGNIQWVSRPVGGDFGTAQTLSATGGSPDVATSSGGRGVAVWVQSGVIQSAIRSGTNNFGTAAPVSGSSASEPRVAVNDRGEAYAVWLRDASVVQAATATATSGLANPQDISNVFETSGAPGIAADGTGNAAAIYEQTSTDVVRVAGYDGAPPAVDDLTLTPGGAPGQGLPMSVATSDVWSAFTTTWTFGDGQSTTGNAVSHAYGAVGTFNVAVSATDAVGNRSVSLGGPVQIFSPPPPDSDGDGFNVTLDCNDANRTIFPAAPEIPGDKVDQDCNGKDAPFPLLLADVTFSFDRNAARTRFFLTQLAVKDALRGMKIEMLCSGKPKCTFKRKRAGTARRARVNILKKLTRKQRRFKLGQTLSVRMTMPGHVGKFTKIKFSKRKTRSVELCLPPGSKKPRKRCT